MQACGLMYDDKITLMISTRYCYAVRVISLLSSYCRTGNPYWYRVKCRKITGTISECTRRIIEIEIENCH